MSDILPQIEPETSGRVTRLDVPLSQYMATSFQAGQSDSMLHAFQNLREDQVDKSKTPNTLTADQANEKYKVGDLNFTQPVNEGMAQAMNQRERQKMDQNAILYSGATKGRFLPGMAARILGATANPVDFGSMFIPFVGEAGKANALFEAGRPVAGALARGLITSEQIARTGFPMPKLIASMTQATIWGGMADVPKMYESHVEGQPQPSVGLDMLGQAAFAGILHGVGHGLKFVSDTTHEVMSKQAMNDFLQDKDISAHQYLPMDEHVIQQQAIEREVQLRTEASKSIDLQKIAEEYRGKNLEYAVKAAIKSAPTANNSSGIFLGQHHWMIPEAQNDDAVRGMWTNKGRFVTMDEAAKLHGLPEKANTMTSEELLYGAGDPEEFSSDERKVYADMLDKGFSDAEAINTVRANSRQKIEQHFMSDPKVRDDIENLRKQAIDKWVEDKKQELKNPISKETQRAATEELTPHDDVEKYNGDQEHLGRALDEDIEGLGHDVQQKPEVNPDFEKYQKLTESLKSLPLNERFAATGEIEKLKNKYGGMTPPEKPPVVNAIDTAVDCLLRVMI